MAVQERSLGPLYAALCPANQRWVPPHLGGIVEECRPFRRGRVVLLPVWPYRLLALGLWWRFNASRSYQHLGDDQWIMADDLDYRPLDIKDWSRGEEKPT